MVSLCNQSFRIGHLANRFGVCPETIRVWERQGLIPPASRTAGGHRRYTFAHVDAMNELIAPAAASGRGSATEGVSRF